MTRVCGSNETANGHGCMNLVSDDGDHCAAGHQCVPIVSDAFSPEHIGLTVKDVKAKIAFAEQALLQETSVPEIENSSLLYAHSQRSGLNGINNKLPRSMLLSSTPQGWWRPYIAGTITIKIEGAGIRTLIREGGANIHGPLLAEGPFEFRKLFPNGKLPADGEDGWIAVGNGGYFIFVVVNPTDPDATSRAGRTITPMDNSDSFSSVLHHIDIFGVFKGYVFVSLTEAVEYVKNWLGG